MTEENNKSKYITEENLDKRLEEQTQVIIEAVNSVMEKQTKEIREELYIVRKELKDEMDKNTEELKRDINNVQTLIDGYVKAQEGFRQEFEIMKEEISQMKKIIKEKLGLDIKAI